MPQENCTEIVVNTDVPFRRLEHYKIHEYTKKWNMTQQKPVGPAGQEPISMTMTTNIDAMFKRKRGRPPKNRVIEVSIFLFEHYGRFIVTFLGVKLLYFHKHTSKKIPA